MWCTGLIAIGMESLPEAAAACTAFHNKAHGLQRLASLIAGRVRVWASLQVRCSVKSKRSAQFSLQQECWDSDKHYQTQASMFQLKHTLPDSGKHTQTQMSSCSDSCKHDQNHLNRLRLKQACATSNNLSCNLHVCEELSSHDAFQ